MGYSPWGCKESGTTERLHFTSLCSLCSESSGLIDHYIASFVHSFICSSPGPALVPGLLKGAEPDQLAQRPTEPVYCVNTEWNSRSSKAKQSEETYH